MRRLIAPVVILLVLAFLASGCFLHVRYDNLMTDCEYSNGSYQVSLSLYHDNSTPYDSTRKIENLVAEMCKELAQGVKK